MDGFKRLVFKLTPIIMLICFICIGITHTFSRENDTQSLTYLTNETITINDNGTETTEDDIKIENYTFNFTAYRQNINANKLFEATTNVIDLQAFNNQYSTFNIIWADGYQIGDIIKTIGNAVLLLININLVAINIILMPIRIISAILITSFSLIGININRTEGVIIPFLNGVISYLTIPLINSTAENNNGQYESIANTTWTFNNEPEIPYTTNITIKGIQFTNNNTSYTSITIKNRTKAPLGEVVTYEYGIWFNNTLVYDSSWIDQQYRTIKVTAVQNQKTNELLYNWLNKLATNDTPNPPVQPDTYGTSYLIQTYYVSNLTEIKSLNIPFSIINVNNNTIINYNSATFSNRVILYVKPTLAFETIWNNEDGWEKPPYPYAHIYISTEQTLNETQENQLNELIQLHVLAVE